MRFLSWVVMAICSVVVYYVAVFLIWLVVLAVGAISTLTVFWQIVIYLLGGSTLIAIIFAPLQYGGILTVSTSEAVKPSKAGTRYKVFAIAIMVLFALEFIASIIISAIDWAALYVIAFGISLLISANATMKSKEEERFSQIKAGQNYTKDDIIDALSKGLITPEDAKQKLNDL